MTTTHDRNARVRMDRFDRDILKYMLLWDPHGVLYDEDLFPEFGMTVPQFRERFVHLVASYDLRGLDPADRDLVEGARRYLPHCQTAARRTHGHRDPTDSGPDSRHRALKEMAQHGD
jgi:hypothetical protein